MFIKFNTRQLDQSSTPNTSSIGWNGPNEDPGISADEETEPISLSYLIPEMIIQEPAVPMDLDLPVAVVVTEPAIIRAIINDVESEEEEEEDKEPIAQERESAATLEEENDFLKDFAMKHRLREGARLAGDLENTLLCAVQDSQPKIMSPMKNLMDRLRAFCKGRRQ